MIGAVAIAPSWVAVGAPPDIQLSSKVFVGQEPNRAEPLSVPRVLSEHDAAIYRKAFTLHKIGRWRPAARLIEKLEDPILVGHLWAAKFLHPTKYRSKYPELHLWLKRHADHPQASRIYRLALKRRLTGWNSPRKPVGKTLTGNGPTPIGAQPKSYKSARKRSKETRKAAARQLLQIRRLIRRGWPTGALRKLEGTRARRLFDEAEYAIAQAEIAHGYFVFGKDALALKLANQSIDAAPQSIPVAAWTGGLAAWRLGKTERAADHFQVLAGWLNAGPGARAAGAYWASRAHLVNRRPKAAAKWLAQAATVPGTFYGLLARRALGIDKPLDWSLPGLTPVLINEISASDSGRRGFALLELGMYHEAEREFRRLFAQLPDHLRPVVMSIAAQFGMPALAMRAAGVLKSEGHRPYYAALFPVPAWKMSNEAQVDPSLIYAVVRQESHFNPRAKSGRGARGLMQLMPRTAAMVGEDRSLRRRSGQHTLFKPEVSLELGGRYIRHLMNNADVKGDLFKMLAAYNAGPGNLRKWQRKVNYQNDPLLFIESIPSRETRNFIEAVLRNLWMYRLQRSEPVPSLDDVAAGSWPLYESVEGIHTESYYHARN